MTERVQLMLKNLQNEDLRKAVEGALKGEITSIKNITNDNISHSEFTLLQLLEILVEINKGAEND